MYHSQKTYSVSSDYLEKYGKPKNGNGVNEDVTYDITIKVP